jgi:hypothetical protein
VESLGHEQLPTPYAHVTSKKRGADIARYLAGDGEAASSMLM